MSVKITICGDLCPTPDTQPLFDAGDEKALFNECLAVFQNSDLVVGNMEFPLADEGKAVAKTGPVLSGKPHFAEVFKNAGFHLLGMANNHIKDLGPDAVLSSMQTVKEYGMNHVGAGQNLSAAKKPFLQKINGQTIGVMAFAEQEFNTASETEAGANFLDVYYDFEHITEVRKQVDYLVVLYHGGIEYHPYPSPDLQKRCRRMVEAGADLVTCQHSHCIGSKEEYQGSTIVYGQGNTLFGYRANDVSWNQGLLIQISLSDNQTEVNYLPVTATKQGINLLSEADAREVINEFEIRNEQIKEQNFIHEQWDGFCESKRSLYMPLLFGFNRILIHANRLLGNRLVNLLYSARRKRVVQNLIRCEAHQEVVRTLLNKKR